MKLIGHDEAWSQWRRALSGHRMHHGWILAGKAGLGKMRFALDAARELVREEGIAQPDGEHPDIIVLAPLPKDEKEEKKREEGKPYETKRNISVGQIRAMQQRLTTRPTLGSRRVIIIDPADDLEKSASNALLKSLEEPPSGTYFLLVTHRPARLLPTIRSRCRMLRFPDLSPEEVAAVLTHEAPLADSAARSAAVAASGGSAGGALAFIEQELGPVDAVISQILAEGDPDFVLRGELARVIGQRPDRGRIQAVFELSRALLADLVADAPPAKQRAIIEAHSELVDLAAQAPTYNFDAGLLVMEIGTLLARAAKGSEQANV